MQQDATGCSFLIEWFNANQIYTNISKTCLLCFHSPYKQPKICSNIYLHDKNCSYCSCPPLELKSSFKYLGMTFDETLSWNFHIQELAKRLRLVCVYMYALRSICDVSVRKMVYKGLGESILRYGITIYGTASLYKLNILSRILYRIASNLAYGTSCHDKAVIASMEHFEMLPVHKQFIFDILRKNFFHSVFKIDNIKVRPLRQSEKYVIPRIYTNYGKKPAVIMFLITSIRCKPPRALMD